VKICEPWRKLILELLSDASKLVLQRLPITGQVEHSETVLQDGKVSGSLLGDMFAQ
jgi:hypothetical protein